MESFTYQSSPMRVLLGAGTLGQLPAELERLGISRALILATPNQEKQAADVAAMLGDRAAGNFTLKSQDRLQHHLKADHALNEA